MSDQDRVMVDTAVTDEGDGTYRYASALPVIRDAIDGRDHIETWRARALADGYVPAGPTERREENGVVVIEGDVRRDPQAAPERLAPIEPVQTAHIQRLIRNGLALAAAANGQGQSLTITVSGREVRVATIDALEKASADLRHAAEELTAERLGLLGWPQT